MPRSFAPAGTKRATTIAPLAQRVLGELRGERVDHWPDVLRNLSLADVAGQLAFDPQAYTRVLLAADDEAELLLMGWLPGQASAIHDHGRSSGAALVLAGEAEEETFELTGDGGARRLQARRLRRGDATVERPSDVHRVLNPTTGLLVTLHAYGPRLAGYGTYEA